MTRPLQKAADGPKYGMTWLRPARYAGTTPLSVLIDAGFIEKPDDDRAVMASTWMVSLAQSCIGNHSQSPRMETMRWGTQRALPVRCQHGQSFGAVCQTASSCSPAGGQARLVGVLAGGGGVVVEHLFRSRSEGFVFIGNDRRAAKVFDALRRPDQFHVWTKTTLVNFGRPSTTGNAFERWWWCKPQLGRRSARYDLPVKTWRGSSVYLVADWLHYFHFELLRRGCA